MYDVQLSQVVCSTFVGRMYKNVQKMYNTCFHALSQGYICCLTKILYFSSTIILIVRMNQILKIVIIQRYGAFFSRVAFLENFKLRFGQKSLGLRRSCEGAVTHVNFFYTILFLYLNNDKGVGLRILYYVGRNHIQNNLVMFSLNMLFQNACSSCSVFA